MQTRRLFFGLALPDALQQQIVSWRAQAFPADIGYPVAAANLHLTLAFLGDVHTEKATALSQLAARIRQPGFSLTLNDAGHWPRPGVVWLGTRQAPRGLLQLAALLRSQAARNGCHQSPQPFHPHITLLRGVMQPLSLPPRDFAFSCDITQFSLFQSMQTQGRTRYHLLDSWPLSE